MAHKKFVLVLLLLVFYQCEENVTEPENNKPEIDYILAKPLKIETAQTCTLIVIANDPDKDKLTYTWSSDQGVFPMGVNGDTVLWQAPEIVGEYQCNVKVSDPYSTDKSAIILNVGQNPILSISHLSLDFDSTKNELEFVISNAGTGKLDWILNFNKNWFDVSPSAGSTLSDSSRIRVTVNRNNMQAGQYSGIISLLTNGGNANINVSMDVAESHNAGSFQLTWLENITNTLLKPSSETKQTQNLSFDLGDIRKTTDFFFILTNTGDHDIKDITLSVDNSSFSVYPETINLLPPTSTINLNNMDDYSILKLTAYHGSSQTGSTGQNLMNMGPNSTKLTMNGNTTNQLGENIAVDLETDINVNALLMNLCFFDQNRELDFLKYEINISSPHFKTRELVRGFYVKDTVTVKNTGNIPLMVQKYGKEETLILDSEKAAKFFVGNYIFLMFDAGDVVKDMEKYPILSDGKCYFYFERNR